MHLKYDELSLPRSGDMVVMEFAMSKGLGKDELLSISRVEN